MTSNDPYELERFVAAQEPAFETALAELRAGHKRSHWMWFIFPQMRGLGKSSAAEFYGIGSLGEGRAYLAHPVLGAHLREATKAVLAHRDVNANAIFGSPDDLKFRSSMTLFARLDPAGPFQAALDAFFEGGEDRETIRMLNGDAGD